MDHIKIDDDIAALSHTELQNLYMDARLEARAALKSVMSSGNDNCFDGLIKTCESILPEHERKLYSRGKFLMTAAEVLGYCRLWVLDQLKHGNVKQDNVE